MKTQEQEGKVKGNALKNDLKYLRKTEGQESVEKLERALQQKGIDISFDEVKSMEWYPIQWQVEFLLQTKELFNWTEEEIFEMGYHAPQYSLLFKLFLRYFTNMDSALKRSNKYWRKHFTIGEIEYHKPNPNKKEIVFNIKNFKVHPVICTDLRGYIKFFIEILTDSDKIQIDEVHCPFKDKADFHQFNIKWE